MARYISEKDRAERAAEVQADISRETRETLQQRVYPDAAAFSLTGAQRSAETFKRQQKEYMANKYAGAAKSDRQAAKLAKLIAKAEALVTTLQTASNSMFTKNAASATCQARGMSGDMTLTAQASENVDAADLNAATAGTFRKSICLKLEDTNGTAHDWANFQPVLTASESVADGDVSAPTVKWAVDEAETPLFVNGYLELIVEFDTDAGATKTYAAADSVSVDIQVAADDKHGGHAVAMVTKTFNVV